MKALPLAAILAGGLACSEQTRAALATTDVWRRSDAMPEEQPRILNAELPFRYPTREYAMHVEGNVTLHLYVTVKGDVLPDSTRIVESSGQPALDSAALASSRKLQFRPARKNGVAVPVSIQFPVYYRHPEGPP